MHSGCTIAVAFRRTLLALLLLTGALPLVACTTNAATGARHINYFSREEEIKIGEEAMPQLVSGYGGAVPDPELQQYVTSVGMSLVEHVEGDYGELPWEFTLLNSPVINAFALPGGKVFISRGLAERFDNEAQLAGVLGHEVGHVTAEHADRAMQRKLLLAGLAVGVGVAAGAATDEAWVGVAAGAAVSGAGVFALRYDRNQESESDKLGMRYMTAAGWDPRGMRQVMEVLKEASAGSSQPEWLSTHPLPSTRIDRIDKMLRSDKYQRVMQDGEHGFYEARFRQRYLERSLALPPAPEPQRTGGVGGYGDPAFAQAYGWCAVCAARAELARRADSN